MLVKFIRRTLLKLKAELSNRQFLVFTATIVGLSAGVMAVVLKALVHFLQNLFHSDRLFSPERSPHMVFLPTIGILFTLVFIQKILRGDLGKGVSNILYEIAKKSALVKRHKLYSHVVTSALTVGFGGSAGLEAPIVITGSAIGSNISAALKMVYRDRTLLLGCGAAAGIAAVFNAPVAGVMFAMEVLLAEVSVSSLIPLVISAACGALFSKIVFDEDTLFSFPQQMPFNWHNVPFYILLGILAAFVSLYYLRIAHVLSKGMKTLPLSIWGKAGLGGLCLALFIYVFPTLFGEGYPTIRYIANVRPDEILRHTLFSATRFQDWAILAFIGATILVKPIATAITLGAGGNGGNFAPSLFVGTHVGFFFAKSINTLGLARLPESNFALVGMAGVLSGVMYAPLTGIFLIAEVTGGYDLILPLMIVSTFSHVFVRHFEPISPEVKDMLERGEVFSHTDKDHNILLLLKTSNLIETDVQTHLPTAKLGTLIESIKTSRRNIFAVVNTEGGLEGVITLDDMRQVMFNTALYDIMTAAELLKAPPSVCTLNEDMNSVMKRFDDTQAWNLPVVDEQERYIGFISKSSVFSKYRHQLMSMSGE